MNPTRFKILLGVAVALVGLFIWNWVSGWGLVTLHVVSQPLTKVIKSIEKQGGTRIVTNADLTTPITMDVDRVTPAEAVDILAARLDGSWVVGYAAGPSKADVAGAIGSFQAGGRDENFARFGFRGGGGGEFGGMDLGETAIDSRRVAWKVSPSDQPQLQSYLGQVSTKTGIGLIVPQTWNPPLAKVPEGGPAAKAVRAMIKTANGQLEEIFAIRVQTDDGRDQGRPRFADNAGSGNGAPARGTDGGFGGPGGGGGRRDFNPEWIEERAKARIEQLPAEERQQAKKDFDEMRNFWMKVRALPEEQRRAAVEEMFNSPAFQERMSERQAARDERSGPQRRAQRARDYIQRKQAIKNSNTSS